MAACCPARTGLFGGCTGICDRLPVVRASDVDADGESCRGDRAGRTAAEAAHDADLYRGFDATPASGICRTAAGR